MGHLVWLAGDSPAGLGLADEFLPSAEFRWLGQSFAAQGSAIYPGWPDAHPPCPLAEPVSTRGLGPHGVAYSGPVQTE